MFTDSDLKELLSFKSNHPVLSVYLNTGPSEGNAEALKLRLRSMLKDVDSPNDIEVVMRYYEHEHDWSGRSVAVFSCAPENWLKTYTLAVPVRNRVRIGNRPHVKPLVDLLDSYGGYGVVLVDKQAARLFYFHLGRLREEADVSGESVRRTKRGGGSQAPGRRGGTAGQTDYVDEVAERNMRDVVEVATRFFGENNVRRILIGGTDDNVSQFRSMLPKAWQSLVVGTFPVSMTASHNEILERAMKIGRQAEIQHEKKLAGQVVTSAAKGKGGVIDLEDTLNAVREGRVQLLLIRDGFREPGRRCQSCGYLSTKPLDVCPYCGSEFEPITDAVELAVRNVIRSGGEVEVMHKDQVVSGFDQIGALLRY